ncbi:uncharacterized protein PV07_01745 [Cladophialophora immunda]|uniref:Cupin type-2 domain-containing protein n=1 Tax=Cladophialophora immunda TaxID=569365 RepID=A0A0D2CV94_9EURO|nr:uncharacterized protein PV07_01745 [Cladophialophora immunda]KIW35018.1 hypothetical protein PV07_01745 [Cladophialophora immunda]OQV10582.1 Cupin domain-containing protein [Cladophialophora immunda]
MGSIATDAVQRDFLKRLPAKNVGPLWTVMDALVSQIPAPKATPAIWRYDELHPDLITASQIIPEEQAERRVLMLNNPSMKAPYTTDTLYAGLQIINPGETAPAHKHVAFALRYIIEGSRGFTSVDGKKISMEKGDVILTPSWTFHDHGHEGQGPMIWLDGLDLPLFQGIPVNFAQAYHEKRFPREPVESSPNLHFPWAPVKELLSSSRPHSVHHYLTPDGDPISNTLSAQAERVAAGTTSPAIRETCSFVYHIPQGTGSTRIVSGNGTETILKWKENDTFAVPAWSSVSHTASDQGDVYLFAFSDRGVLERLGFYRKQEE